MIVTIILIIEGRIHIFGDNVDTDVIVPGRYLTLNDPSEIAQHLFEGIDPDFVKKARSGDILIAGRNFGSGSSREHAVIGLKALGVGCIVAKSFARIFLRNAVNVGLSIIICPEAVSSTKEGSFVKIDTKTGIVNVDGIDFKASPFPPFLQEMINNGGLMEWVRQELVKKTLR